jgi:hypothetical protein
LPDAVQNLQDAIEVTSAYVIGLTWEDGPSNNGRPILDYKITYDQATDSWVDLVEGVTDLEYTTEIGLVAGETYKLRVYARNSVGFSAPTEITILVAQVPDQLDAPVSVYDDPNVVISWVAPFDGGSDIISYSILIREADGVTFTPELQNCDGSDATIMIETECTILTSVLRGAPHFLIWGDSVKV